MNKNRIYLYVMSVIIVFSAAYPALSVADIQTGFEFGNHIDTHQETKLQLAKDVHELYRYTMQSDHAWQHPL